jgi:hypothetical protein
MRRASLVILLLLLFVASASAQVGELSGIGLRATPLADVTVTGSATLIGSASGNPDRVEMSCTNTHATVAVRWGGTTATAASVGQRIPAGAAIAIANRGPIYMASEGANVTMSCTEETR